MSLTEEQVEFFWENGYLAVPNFFDHETCDTLQQEMSQILTKYDPKVDAVTTFSTVNQTSQEYFLTSGDKIRYFFEEGAVDKDGNVQKDIPVAINKVGHALHWLNPVFRDFTLSERIAGIFKSLKFEQPRIAQSMYIFKQPGIGGEVVPHQDSTFLNTSPTTTVGVWIPLQDCTLENGCLWMIPGSHKDGLSRRMLRKDDDSDTYFDHPQPEYDDSKFIPAETTKGTLVLIHGEVVHKSEANKSSKSRHAYTFHSIETKPGVEYDRKNWLQPTEDLPFVPLFKDQRDDKSMFDPKISA